MIYAQIAISYLKANDKAKAKINLELAKLQIESAIDTNQNTIFLENQKRINNLYEKL